MKFVARVFTLVILHVSLTSPVSGETTNQPVHRVEVRLPDATTQTGTVDRRSDEDYLWLRIELGSTVVIRPIERATVLSITPVIPASTATPSADRKATDAQRAKRALFDPDFVPLS